MHPMTLNNNSKLSLDILMTKGYIQSKIRQKLSSAGFHFMTYLSVSELII